MFLIRAASSDFISGYGCLGRFSTACPTYMCSPERILQETNQLKLGEGTKRRKQSIHRGEKDL